MENFTYTDKEMADVVQEALKNTSFLGVTVRNKRKAVNISQTSCLLNYLTLLENGGGGERGENLPSTPLHCPQQFFPYAT